MLGVVPKLWTETIETHRREVHGAILDTTAALVAEHGLASVTMSLIAEETGIGRATLYKYFSDVEAILVAWHDQHVDGHLEYLTEIRDRSNDAAERIEAVLEAYARITYERSQKHGDAHDTGHRHRGDHAGRSHNHHGSEISALVHRDEHVRRAQRRLNDFFRDLLAEGARSGDVRDDVATEELAGYCVQALGAAGALRSKPAVRRLVAVTLSGLRPQR
jgi:AcrR family transcriptional regulator